MSDMKRSFTIAHTECSRGWGGQEIRIFTEMQAMQARGHQLLLAAPADAAIYRKALEAGLEVFAFKDAGVSFLLSMRTLAAWFRQCKVHVVNTHSSRDGWIGGIAARLAGTPLLIRSRHIEVEYPSRFRSRIAFHHLPHHVLTTSRQISLGLIRAAGLDENHITCLPTGIDLARFHPGVPGCLHAELGLPGTTPLVGMISVLRSWKGHAFFLEAASQLIKQGCPAHFVIAGDGPGKDAIHERIRALDLFQRVHWLGHREDVPSVLASLDILVLPSTAHEGIPQIILQAQAMSKAVIGTTVGGIPEVVTEGETGLLMPPKDSTALVRAIGQLLADSPLRLRLGATARQRIQTYHSLDTMCHKLEAIYGRYLKPETRTLETVTSND